MRETTAETGTDWPCVKGEYLANVPATDGDRRDGWATVRQNRGGPMPDRAPQKPSAKKAGKSLKEKRDAKKEKKAAETLLVGVDPGTYGRYEVVARSRHQPDWAAWARLVQVARSNYEAMPESRRGNFADWVADIRVPKRLDTWTEVKRVRAHQRPKDTTAPPKEKVPA